MTRKLKVGSFVSLDGVIENPTKIAGSCFDEEVKEYSFEALAYVEFLVSVALLTRCSPRVWRRKVTNTQIASTA
jgi:hypothetical protein